MPGVGHKVAIIIPFRDITPDQYRTVYDLYDSEKLLNLD